MKNIQKYFEFTGTINGLNYFLRNIISGIVATIGGIFVGMGISTGNIGYASLGFIFVGPSVWMGACNIFKRMNALYPSNANVFTALLIGLQVTTEFFTDETINGILKLVLFVIAMILIFKNSNIETHKG
jgi:uncharacterized membrane protein YhaH (DUF805 family)